MNITIIRQPLTLTEWQKLADAGFGDMIKGVADLERKIVAVGGELHADCEAVLLEDGSRQADLWGYNFYPARLPESQIEYTSLINIRPRQGNRSIEIKDQTLRDKVKAVVVSLVKLS